MTIWITSNSWQQGLSYKKKKTINFSTQIQNYFLTSLSRAVLTFVVPNLSHPDYLNLPVTVDNKLLATTKQKGQRYFSYLANKYGITFPSSSFLSINATAFWLPQFILKLQYFILKLPSVRKFLRKCLLFKIQKVDSDWLLWHWRPFSRLNFKISPF